MILINYFRSGIEMGPKGRRSHCALSLQSLYTNNHAYYRHKNIQCSKFLKHIIYKLFLILSSKKFKNYLPKFIRFNYLYCNSQFENLL
jgi:hypothetical protein